MQRYARATVILMGAVCAGFSAAIDYPFDVERFDIYVLALFPATLVALGYLLKNTAESRGYAWAAGASCLAFVMIPLSLSFGPIFPALIGMGVLAWTRRDLLFGLGSAAALVAVLVADDVARALLGAPIRGMEPGLEGSVVYSMLAGILVVLAVTALARRPEPPSASPGAARDTAESLQNR